MVVGQGSILNLVVFANINDSLLSTALTNYLKYAKILI